MENLQKLLPYFQDQLLQWYQFTLDKPDYAIAVAVSVWLLMAIFYSIRIGFLKRHMARITKANTDIQASLNAAQEQIQLLQQQANEANEQMQNAVEVAESETQRANAVEQRLVASNKQLADSLANLVESFELNLHNLPAANADNLLSEYQSVVTRVVERFSNEQQAKTQLQLSFHAESAKLAEKEMLISSLQHRLDTQTQQLAQMELAIEQYEAAQRQLQADRDQQLAVAMAKQQAEAVRIADLEKQQSEKQSQSQVSTIEQREYAPEPLVKEAATPIIAEAKPESIKTQSTGSEKPDAKVQSSATVASKKTKTTGGGKFKGLFGRAMEKVAKMDQKLGTQSTVNVEPEQMEAVAEEAKPVELKQAEVLQAEKPAAEQKKEPKQSEGMSAKMSGLFGGFKKSSAKQAATETSPQQAEVVVAESVNEQVTAESIEPAKSGKKIPNQLTGLFGKFKSKK